MVPSALVDEFVIAARNVLRQRRRSAMAINAIALGIIALMLAGGFIDWLLWALRENAIHSQIGHIQVMRPGYRSDGEADPFRYLLPEASPELTALERIPELKTIGPRLSFNGLVSHGESTLGFVGDGVEPDRERLLSEGIGMVQGRELSADDPHGIIMGKGLAASLGVGVGDVVVLMANTSSGGINAVECRVRGLFRTPAKAYDDTALRMPIPAARELLRVSGAHLWVMLLADTEQSAHVLEELKSQFRGEPLEFVLWSELADFYNKTVALFTRQVGVMKAIIGLIIVLSISNTLSMSVMERTGEIGTTMALGVRRATIHRQFLIEGLLLGLFGGLIGVVVGGILSFAISWIGIPMPPPPGMESGYTAEIQFSWQLTFDALLLAVGTALVASLYPSWKASRMVIVDALRFNR